MTNEELKRIKGYYNSLLEQKKIYENSTDKTHHLIEHYSVDMLETEINKINSDFPDIIPVLNKRLFFTYNGANGRISYYDIKGILSYLAIVISKLKIITDDEVSSPVTELKVFSFIQNAPLQKIIERDYQEIQRTYIAKCWKSVIILSGGAIEAILIDLLQQNITNALNSPSAPKNSDIIKWDLCDLIKVSVELKLLSSSIDKLSHSVREYRNLIHPGNEIRNQLVFGEEEAKIAIEILNILHRELINN